MNGRKLFSIILSVLVFTSILFKSPGQADAAPTSPTDPAKVPHYFGPYPNWANSPLTHPDATVQINGDGQGATGVATVGANGAVTGLTLTDPGSGYSAATVDITGAGSGATATASVAKSGSVTSVALSAGGGGYTAPSVAFTGGGGSGTLQQVGNQLITRSFATDYATPPGTLGPVLVVVPVSMPASGVVQSIEYFNQATPGSSPSASAGNLLHAYILHASGAANQYTTLWDSGTLTVPLTTDPVGVVETIPVPNIAVTSGDVIAFYGEGVALDDAGTGSDFLVYPAPNAPALGSTVALGGADFPIYSQTRTYSFAATVLDTSGVISLTPATAIANGSVDQVTLDSGGSGYQFPTIDFDMPDAPDGVQARAHAVWDTTTGAITAIVVDNPGSGYATAPNVVIRDGTLFDPILNGGSGATASATLSITAILIDQPGDGYISAPQVIINDPTGLGAVASAQVNAGSITGLTLVSSGSGYVTPGGIKKFSDALPGLCQPPACPASGKYIPLGVPEVKTYNGVQADEYVIGLVQYRTSFSSSMPEGTLVRGYVQLETPANAGISQHFPLTNELMDGTQAPVMKSDGVTQWLALTPPQYLGPTLAATKDRPVRIVFYNLLPTGAGGDLFLPTDSTMMGSGMGPMDMGMGPMDMGSVLDGIRNPACSEYPKSDMCFKDNRATLHLHGGISPWISDGTPHQWITPAGEMTQWPQGVSVQNVPDMNVCNAANDGCQTFYYTNQQSARLMFYHDHAWGITRLNVYAGEAAGYLISDNTEQALISSGTIPGAANTIPLIVQDRTFVPDAAQLALQDPTWDTARWGSKGSFWYHHVYMPAQNPGDPSGMSAYGRWMYGPWFWPPAAGTLHGPIANPYYDPSCNLDVPSTWQYQTDPFCEPAQIPGTPNISVGMEQFNDTPIVNGVAYPTLTVQPQTYRLRLLNAANDRFFNFQWYVGDPSTASTGTNSQGQVIGATEVALNPAELAAAQLDPNVFPTPVQTTATAGPDWVQIGSEGGFLPAPVVVDGQQVTTWITDPTRFDVGNVDKHSLLLAPAERADVLVDFSKFAGKTLILYNDAPAAFPARVSSYDYYTGAPDLSPVGAPTILPGYGPNTRTIIQVKVAATTPATAFDLPGTSSDGLGKLQKAFLHNASGTGVFEAGQHPIIVGQAAYNSAYGTGFAASSNCNAPGSSLTRCDGLVRINDTTSFGFNTLKGQTTKMSMGLQPKAIHDEMNASTFDEYGRMQANLGVEAQPPTPGAQNVVLYPYTNPATELIDATNLPKGDLNVTPISSASDGTQIWRITHNGVDTHPIHFHLYDVQLVNRVTWDNIILPAEATELGWKDTVRVSPLEDTIVALRPIIPTLPWELPNAIRALNPMMPLGSTMGFNNTDANGNPTTPIMNGLVNFGWEYVYHCHILSHEEMDMMRPVSVAVPPVAPDGLAYTTTGSGNKMQLVLTFNDNSIAETGYVIQRNDGTGWVNLGTIVSPLNQPNVKGVKLSFTDTTYSAKAVYQYRVVAQNTIGYGGAYMSMTVTSQSAPMAVSAPLLAPTTLAATLQAGPKAILTWTDNSTGETGYVVERADNGGAFVKIATTAAFPGTGPASFADQTIQAGNTYAYRVAAVNGAVTSAYTNTVTLAVPAMPAAPSNFSAVNGTSPTRTSRAVILTWTDNSNNETGFTIQRATNASFTSGLSTVLVAANTTSLTQNNLSRNTIYYYRIRANNGTFIFTTWVPAAPITTLP